MKDSHSQRVHPNVGGGKGGTHPQAQKHFKHLKEALTTRNTTALCSYEYVGFCSIDDDEFMFGQEECSKYWWRQLRRMLEGRPMTPVSSCCASPSSCVFSIIATTRLAPTLREAREI